MLFQYDHNSLIIREIGWWFESHQGHWDSSVHYSVQNSSGVHLASIHWIPEVLNVNFEERAITLIEKPKLN